MSVRSAASTRATADVLRMHQGPASWKTAGTTRSTSKNPEDLSGAATAERTGAENLQLDSEDFASSKLQWKRRNFYGHQSELQQLQDAFDRMREADLDHSAQMVLIKGISGSGKSSLVKEFSRRQTALAKSQHCFVSGKADQCSTDPFSSLILAFSELSRQVLHTLSQEELRGLEQRFLDAAGNEASSILVDLIPALHCVAGTTCANAMQRGKNHHAINGHSAASKFSPDGSTLVNRQKHAFLAFVKALCRQQQPVALFLDDLQWTDTCALDLIANLMTDSSLQHFVLIGTYRGNEVDADHPLTVKLDEIHQKGASHASLFLGALGVDSAGELISGMMQMEKDELEELSKAIHQTTGGNPFHTIQSLQMLERVGLLRCVETIGEWEWDLPVVKEKLGMSNDVVDLVVAKLQSLPLRLRYLLRVASLLQASFDIAALERLLQTPIPRAELLSLLDVAVMAGLLENSIGSTVHAFGHDRFQQAANALLREGRERDRTCLFVSVRLLEIAESRRGEGWMWFLALYHLNSLPKNVLDAGISELGPEFRVDPIELARLNLKVGKIAVGVSAFVPASECLRKAVDCMEMVPGRWSNHCEFCLDLHTTASANEFNIGNFEEGHLLAGEAMDHSRSEWDRVPLKLALAQALGAQERHEDALAYQTEAARLLGMFPRRWQVYHLIRLVKKTKKSFRQKSDAQMLNLPPLAETQKIMAMNVLSEMAIRSTFCKRMVSAILNGAPGVVFRAGLQSCVLDQGCCNALLSARDRIDV